VQVKVNAIFSVSGQRREAQAIRSERPLMGELVIEEVHGKLPGNPKLVAKLLNPEHRFKEPYCGWLYDPQIGKMDRKGFYLRGFSILEDKERKETYVHMQVWWVREASDFEFASEGRR
jgi:hypothetical protein